MIIKCGQCVAFLPFSPGMVVSGKEVDPPGRFGECRLKSPVSPIVFAPGQLERRWPQVAADEFGCLEGTAQPSRIAEQS